MTLRILKSIRYYGPQFHKVPLYKGEDTLVDRRHYPLHILLQSNSFIIHEKLWSVVRTLNILFWPKSVSNLYYTEGYELSGFGWTNRRPYITKTFRTWKMTSLFSSFSPVLIEIIHEIAVLTPILLLWYSIIVITIFIDWKKLTNDTRSVSRYTKCN